jgi:hypothetical protein
MSNPVTGVIERVYTDPTRSYAEAVQTPGAAEQTAAAAQAEADEAERQGAALGVSVDCEVRANCSPVVSGGSPGSETACLYWSECTVAGNPGHDAGLLIRPGGFQIAVTEASRAAGTPLKSAPVFRPPGAAAPAGSAIVTSAVAPAPGPSPAPLPGATVIVGTAPVYTTNGGAVDRGDSIGGDFMSGNIAGVPVWAIGAGLAAAAAFIAFGGRK